MSDQFLYLTTTGRKTGRPREIEIWYVEGDARLYILAEHGRQAQWVQNILSNPRVNVRIAEQQSEGFARVLDPDRDADVYLKARQLARDKYGWGEGLPVEISVDVNQEERNSLRLSSPRMESAGRINQAAIVFRHAVSADAEALREFAARTYYETFSPANTPENMQAYMASAFTLPQFKAELSDPRAAFLLAEIGGRLCGYAKLLIDRAPECVIGDAPIELVRFYIDQSWQGSGLASALMEACLAEAKGGGFKTIYLGVWEKNLRAQAFYHKWNFVRVGEHTFQMGDDLQIDWWMMRPV